MCIYHGVSFGSGGFETAWTGSLRSVVVDCVAISCADVLRLASRTQAGMADFNCYESGPIGMGSLNGGTTCSKVLAVSKADTKVKAIGVMLADLATDPEMWREVRIKLHGMIEDGELTEGQLRVLEIAYGQVEIARVEAGEQEHVAKERVAEHGRKTKSGPGASRAKGFKSHAAFGDVEIGFGGQGAAIIVGPMTKIPRPCTHFHATPQKECTAGVPIGHLSGKTGQCMYAH